MTLYNCFFLNLTSENRTSSSVRSVERILRPVFNDAHHCELTLVCWCVDMLLRWCLLCWSIAEPCVVAVDAPKCRCWYTGVCVAALVCECVEVFIWSWRVWVVSWMYWCTANSPTHITCGERKPSTYASGLNFWLSQFNSKSAHWDFVLPWFEYSWLKILNITHHTSHPSSLG